MLILLAQRTCANRINIPRCVIFLVTDFLCSKLMDGIRSLHKQERKYVRNGHSHWQKCAWEQLIRNWLAWFWYIRLDYAKWRNFAPHRMLPVVGSGKSIFGVLLETARDTEKGFLIGLCFYLHRRRKWIMKICSLKWLFFFYLLTRVAGKTGENETIIHCTNIIADFN